jgi:hypothetical protein
VAAGSAITDSAISGSTFTAIGDIGLITARSRGAFGITGSTFTADSDGNYDPNSVIPDELRGNIAGIVVEAAGRNLLSSTGIDTSTFLAANIGDITVDVTTVEGGDGISGSTFTAQTSVYDGNGNYNNTGSIGNITVKNAADQLGVGEGIFTSSFSAGPAGKGIGNITVTCVSGAGISTSTFDASVLATDIDQDLYKSKIGNITVKTGRNNNFTLLPSGIALSTFKLPLGLGISRWTQSERVLPVLSSWLTSTGHSTIMSKATLAISPYAYLVDLAAEWLQVSSLDQISVISM